MGNVYKGGSWEVIAPHQPPNLMMTKYLDEDGFLGMFGTLGRNKRGFVSSLVRQLVKVPYRAFGELKQVAPGVLNLV